ncbi:MAG: class I tRNA ligase family protein [Acidimicrobiales bacterium]
MPLPYEHHEVEARWQRRWASDRRDSVDLDRVEPDRKLYNLVEFPYPSADGLHVGHALTYSGADTWGRYQRRRGFTVFQPIGFDAFGINAENYALRTGEHPRRLIARTVVNYRRQLVALGGAWTWDSEVVTSDPSYYRWTQWLFLRLYDAGLAYQAEAPVLWCPSCQTVLAREQVDDLGGEDRCERCGSPVVERVMRQWFLRITAYADRLVDGIDALDWPAKAKNRQRAWIGRKVGADGRASYHLHDWLISRQRYWGPPIPIIHCGRCGAVPVPDDELPVLLPEVDDPAALRPTGTGRSPLASIPDWVDVGCPKCGAPSRRETDVSDTFFDSSWYFLRYPSVDVDDRPWDPARTARWLPVDHYAGGPEHVVRHHLYARFVTMALQDGGWVPFAEPFPRIRLHGFLTLRGAKMSKSSGNVVNPDELIERHGADVTRLALLFTRPWDADGEWDPAVVTGVERFLGRVYRVVTGPTGEDRDDGDEATAVARAVARVGPDLDRMRFNVAIAELMTLVGRLRGSGPPTRRAKTTLVSLLAPLAPHVTEELWAGLGEPRSVHDEPWPDRSVST